MTSAWLDREPLDTRPYLSSVPVCITASDLASLAARDQLRAPARYPRLDTDGDPIRELVRHRPHILAALREATPGEIGAVMLERRGRAS
jgi:hypothetical protein